MQHSRLVVQDPRVNGGAGMGKLRILVAEDEEGIRESLGLVLGDYDVTFAADGQEALDHLAQTRFDLVLLDIKMPKVDGLEIMRYLKRQPNAPAVLILTAYQSVEMAKEAVKLGAVDYLPKPFDRDHILEAIRDILSRPSPAA